MTITVVFESQFLLLNKLFVSLFLLDWRQAAACVLKSLVFLGSEWFLLSLSSPSGSTITLAPFWFLTQANFLLSEHSSLLFSLNTLIHPSDVSLLVISTRKSSLTSLTRWYSPSHSSLDLSEQHLSRRACSCKVLTMCP